MASLSFKLYVCVCGFCFFVLFCFVLFVWLAHLHINTSNFKIGNAVPMLQDAWCSMVTCSILLWVMKSIFLYFLFICGFLVLQTLCACFVFWLFDSLTCTLIPITLNWKCVYVARCLVFPGQCLDWVTLVSVLWLGEIASFICECYPNVYKVCAGGYAWCNG